MAKITAITSERTSPEWSADWLDPHNLVPGGSRLDPAQFRRRDAVKVETTGTAAIGATTVPVVALTGPIPSGSVIHFDAGEFAYLTAAGAPGDTSLAVEALPTALESGDVGYYEGVGTKSVVSGTPIGRTYAERDAGTAFGPAVDTDDELYLLAFTVVNVDEVQDAVLVRPNTAVWENRLPDWANYSANLQAALRATFLCLLSPD